MAEVKPGDILAGKYRVEHVLGEGGMGLVVAATHLALDERVALKFMRAEALGRDDGVQRFLREARAVVRLKSEHIARVLDVGTLETGAPYIVMEHLEGSDLSDVLIERHALPVDEAVDYLLQACDAIAEAHARGVVHRDLKPANLFVTRGRDGAPLIKVLDFGISKVNALGDRPDSMTSSAAILGSPLYMSPEQMKSSRDVDGTTDIWSLGVILFEAVGGRVPFDEPTIGALMAKVLTEEPPSLATLRPDLPPAFVAVVARCLQKDATRRYPTVVDFARDLVPFGAPSAAERFTRIAAVRSTQEGSAVSLVPPTQVSVAPPHAPASSIFGVAATMPLDPPTVALPATSRVRGLAFYSVLALVAVVIAVGALVSVHTGAPSRPFVGSASGSSPTAAAPAPTPSVAPVPPVDPAPRPTSPTAVPAPEPPSDSGAPIAPRVEPATTRSPSPGRLPGRKPPVRPTSSNAPTTTDPFGNNRQ